jgi:hypothetical protein
MGDNRPFRGAPIRISDFGAPLDFRFDKAAATGVAFAFAAFTLVRLTPPAPFGIGIADIAAKAAAAAVAAVAAYLLMRVTSARKGENVTSPTTSSFASDASVFLVVAFCSVVLEIVIDALPINNWPNPSEYTVLYAVGPVATFLLGARLAGEVADLWSVAVFLLFFTLWGLVFVHPSQLRVGMPDLYNSSLQVAHLLPVLFSVGMVVMALLGKQLLRRYTPPQLAYYSTVAVLVT